MRPSFTTEKFIEKAIEIHGDKYDYSQTLYVFAKQPVRIICKKHGAFEQRPNDHINKKTGCPSCSRCPPFTSEIFIERAKQIHDIKYDYSLIEGIGSMKIADKVEVICPIHGIFSTTARNHINSKAGCRLCGNEQVKQNGIGKRKNVEQFIKEADQIHGQKYNYDKVVYTGTHTPVEIVCPKHGSFFQKPNNHVSAKQGCAECNNEARFGRLGGLNLKNMTCDGTLYLVRFSSSDRSFLKIGIAMHGVKKRWGAVHRGHTVTSLAEHIMPINVAYNIEQFIMMECNGIQQQLEPNTIHGGSTECFIDTPENEELLIDTIMTLLLD